MTESRSFAPHAEEGASAAPPPVFPLLPYACTAYVDQCSRDYARYVDKLAQVDRPLDGEDALGLRMITEMNQAFFALVWAPLGAAMRQASPEA